MVEDSVQHGSRPGGVIDSRVLAEYLGRGLRPFHHIYTRRKSITYMDFSLEVGRSCYHFVDCVLFGGEYSLSQSLVIRS